MPEFGRTAIADIAAIGADRLKDAIRIRQTPSLHAEPITTDSTLERELVFLSGHTIHHLALITVHWSLFHPVECF